jgi:LmbE family N-acetylglucosaminyl deacetylase
VNSVLVIAPHPDDETLGCGGALLGHRCKGDAVHWVVVTQMTSEAGYDAADVARRTSEIAAVAKHYGFATVKELGFPAARLDRVAMVEIVKALSDAVNAASPEVVYVPFARDVHSDHKIVADACSAVTKWFRAKSVRQVLAYETLSETGLESAGAAFVPNCYVDIADHLEGKLAAMRLYPGESGAFPFPRSEQAIRALAALRGANSGLTAAEGFMLLRWVR